MFSLLNFRVGLYLAVRQIKRSNKWTTGFIIFVMLLTFLNLVVVTGVLVGIVEGINEGYRSSYTGDAVITSLDTKNYIEHSTDILSIIRQLPQVKTFSARYEAGGTIESNYETRTNDNDKPEQIGAQIVGINPIAEDSVTHLSKNIIEGSYLAPTDYDQVLLGKNLLAKYTQGFSLPGQTPLTNVSPGSKIRLTINGVQREVYVKGVINSKVDVVSMAVYMIDTEERALIGRDDYNVNTIAMILQPGTDAVAFRDLLKRSGVAEHAKVQTFEDSIPKGVADIKNTFATLGNGISSIGLVVAAITIFIVVFINALTRRKFIGILKGIGISGQAIEIAYMTQSLFYAIIGSGIGLLILYGFLVPAVAAHPINFPFANGLLVAPIMGTAVRVGLLVFATVIAGYIPARMIVKRNTLDSILGRN